MTKARWLEPAALAALAALLAAMVPISTGYMAWSWDALNHHVYLGLVAEGSRWALDVVPASTQSYQWPYLYWPVYRLARLDIGGAAAGAVWSGFQAAMLMLPVWHISDRLLAGGVAPVIGAAADRVLASLLAFSSVLVLVGLETTANDVLATVPLLWAVAMGLRTGPSASSGQAAIVGMLWGLSLACKLSNALALPLIAAITLWPQAGPPAVSRALLAALGAVVGFGLAYGPWGWQLWQLTGNPFYPFLGQFFGPG
jgi:hypothetical protein